MTVDNRETITPSVLGGLPDTGTIHPLLGGTRIK